MLKTVRKILIIKLRDIGDIVLSTPVINVLNENCNSPEIVYVLKKEYEYFKYMLPNVKEVITYDKKDPFDFLRVIMKLRKHKFDLAVNLHATYRSALISLLSGAKLRLVHNHSGKDFFTSVPLGIKEEQKNIIERDLDTLAPLKLGEQRNELKRTKLVLNEEYTKYIDDGDSQVVIGFGIGARRPQKIWPAERFIELGKRYSVRGYTIAVFCSESEREQGKKIVNGIKSGAKLYCGLDFLRMGFFMSKLRLFIGNDSGLRHIAAALGLKTVTLFGPENPVEWHPYTEADGHRSISHLDEFVDEGKDILSREFREKSSEAIERITVEEVVEASDILLKKAD